MNIRVKIGVELNTPGSSPLGYFFNRHLEACGIYLKKHGFVSELVVFKCNGDVSLTAIERLNQFEYNSVTCLESTAELGGVHAYFPSSEPNKALILEAQKLGIAVFQNAHAEYREAEWNDLSKGFLSNKDAEWFARIYPEPVYIGDAEKIFMALGSTINPRAIILNKGIDGAGGHIYLGRGSHIGADCLLNLGPTDFTIGNMSMISANFALHAMRHSLSHISNFSITKGPFKFFGDVYDKSDPVIIGNDVWIGEGVKCLAGVNIPNGVVVGAGAIVTSDLQAYGIYAGNPAKLIRFRFDPEKIGILNSSRWWLFDYDYMREINDAFKQDIVNLSIDELKTIF